jgi:hypothetical protein
MGKCIVTFEGSKTPKGIELWSRGDSRHIGQELSQEG